MDLETAIADYEQRGYRLDMIMPADSPRVAVVSKGSEMLRLSVSSEGVYAEPFAGLRHPVIPPSTQELIVTRAGSPAAWNTGRAGMQYRDLIPGRLGGRYIASHIRIQEAGPVSDYVHHHRVRFQMIFVRKGWVRVVYQDQGAPFVMHEGDCVLQPPGIRHRVLECSPGLEVIEIGCPAEHETIRDHDLALPTPTLDPARNFGGQRFVHHEAATATWQQTENLSYRDPGIAAATNNLASVRVLKFATMAERMHAGDFLFLFVLEGSLKVVLSNNTTEALSADDACAIPRNWSYSLHGAGGCSLLEVMVP